ncbi:MAG: hypothetical protein BWK77_03985, partial [Verrucomicrobia bacterium A1]
PGGVGRETALGLPSVAREGEGGRSRSTQDSRTMTASQQKKYPGKLYHKPPSRIGDGAVFHIRIRCLHRNPVPLTDSELARRLLESVQFYVGRRKWCNHLFLLMPDHLHALLSFAPTKSMAELIGDWKRYHETQHGVVWQDNFFDHRIRNDSELVEKAAYIRRNPVAVGLCASPEEWPWVLGPESGIH